MQLAADPVASADGDAIQRIEHVELRYSQPCEAVDARRVANDDAVEPAAPAGTTGSGAVFVTELTNLRSQRLLELSREWAVPDARGVSFHDPKRRVNRARCDAHPDCSSA